MIAAALKALLDGISGLVQGLPALPELPLPDLSGFIPAYNWLNAVFPVTEGLEAAAVLVAVIVAGTVIRAAITVWHVIPKPFMGT